jgi:hypothetical protein
MKFVIETAALFLLATAIPASAQHVDVKSDGARLDAAVAAGRAKVLAINGVWTPAKTTTSGCTTHVMWGKEDMPIDWKAVTLSDDGTPSMLMISMGPTQDFAVRFSNAAALRTARSVAVHLITACPQYRGR